MGEIREKFDEARKEGRVALIPFIMAGDPSRKATIKIAEALDRAGADMIELGLCFSDPIADGPTIQEASQRALVAGVTPDVYFDMAREIREVTSTPLISLTYCNPILRRGAHAFLRMCKRSGIAGVIVPDLPVDEADSFLLSARRLSVDTIFLVAPTSPPARVKRVVEASTGFVYLVSVLGVTGARRKLSSMVGDLIRRVKSVDPGVPVAVGFGISSPSHVRRIAQLGADGAIVGSALVDIISMKSGKEGRMLARLEGYVRSLKAATRLNIGPLYSF